MVKISERYYRHSLVSLYPCFYYPPPGDIAIRHVFWLVRLFVGVCVRQQLAGIVSSENALERRFQSYFDSGSNTVSGSKQQWLHDRQKNC